MRDNRSFKKIFAILTATSVLALSPSFADAAQKKKPVKRAPVAVAKKAPTEAPPPPVRKHYIPFSATGETCPDPNADTKSPWITPSFSISAKEQQRLLSALEFQIGRDNADGYFVERSTQSVNELRLLTANAPFRDSMSPKDFGDTQDLADNVRRDMRRFGIDDVIEATALRLAADKTGIDVDVLQRNTAKAPMALWLKLIKTHGADIGLGVYAQNIADDLYVANPVMLQEMMALQKHPRVSVMLNALHLKHGTSTQSLPVNPQPIAAQDVRALEILGFDTDGTGGALTAASMQKFNTLYTPALVALGMTTTTPLTFFADQAQKDATTYNISTTAAAAIRLANIRTTADFAYMMELSSAESSFDHEAQARTSSATGLYQFTEDTWLHMVRRYGAKYGLSHLADQIESKDNIYGVLVARVDNPFVRFAALELRRDPHLAALMSAEFQMRNKFIVECSVGHALNRTEQYMGHFLGSQGAAKFLNNMAATPNASAVKLFPTAAAANKAIFYKRDKKGKLTIARSLREVYKALDRKFETGTYEDQSEITSGLEKPNTPSG